MNFHTYTIIKFYFSFCLMKDFMNMTSFLFFLHMYFAHDYYKLLNIFMKEYEKIMFREFSALLSLLIDRLDRDDPSRCAQAVLTKSIENELPTGLIIADSKCSIRPPRLTTSMLPMHRCSCTREAVYGFKEMKETEAADVDEWSWWIRYPRKAFLYDRGRQDK